MLRRHISQRMQCLFPQKFSPSALQLHIAQSRPLNAPHRNIYTLVKRRTSVAHYERLGQNPKKNLNPRNFWTISSVPAILVPPVIFIGLLLSLWTWKCFWIIAMQNKLLYLSWLPPFSRSDTISEYERACKPVEWKEKQIRSLDGTKLAICEGNIPIKSDKNELELKQPKKLVAICYFQGNGGSTPLRLPLLSQVLRAINTKSQNSKEIETRDDTRYIVLALSYRGYWKSSGTATQTGIEKDAQAFLTWVSNTYSEANTNCQIVLWGHSVGSAVASSALSTYLAHSNPIPVSGLIMEAPISNIKDMLIGLYPQKWLPYRYLWPFSWNNWCTSSSLERLAAWRDQVTEQGQQNLPNPSNPRLTQPSQSIPPILILSAESDEVIPAHVAGQLECKGRDLGLDIQRTVVPGAMHIEGPIKRIGKDALVKFILEPSAKKQ
ncbi:hypothetical protein N7478_012165 [Penicillium angulare]|uniref:uncharacterized protein n=1 Tax=Penicillium angulare TaxID=116970 RepID=UPI00253FDBCC|nr:uncharacterized protein N7478_012165 [Penicillium angulare]KAJ5260560.1 hypothetical protein N7478_012165 [Penicillium angulare]